MKVIVSCLAFVMTSLLWAGVCFAAEPEAEINAFIAKLKAGKSTEAVESLYSGNPWRSHVQDDVSQVKDQLAAMNKLVGSLKSHEQLRAISVGTRFKYFGYLAAYDRQPIRFVFEFYKPEGQWKFFGFSLDSEIDADIEKAARESILTR